MHYAILNSSGNVLEWFVDEEAAQRALAEMLGDAPDADLDLVAFVGPGRPAEPVTASARSAWPAARLVWSNVLHGMPTPTTTIGNLNVHVRETNETDDHVKVEA